MLAPCKPPPAGGAPVKTLTHQFCHGPATGSSPGGDQIFLTLRAQPAKAPGVYVFVMSNQPDVPTYIYMCLCGGLFTADVSSLEQAACTRVPQRRTRALEASSRCVQTLGMWEGCSLRSAAPKAHVSLCWGSGATFLDWPPVSEGAANRRQIAVGSERHENEQLIPLFTAFCGKDMRFARDVPKMG